MRLPRPGYASVVATLAVVLALGGPAYAGAKVLLTGNDIKDGSLTSRDVQNGTLTGRDMRNGSLTGLDVKNGSLKAADFNAHVLSSLRRAQGTSVVRGPKGEQGVRGPAGPAGPAGAPAALPSQSSSGPDVVGYADNAPLVDITLPSAGTWLLVGHLRVTNTGASSDNLNCLYDVDGVQNGAFGSQVDPAATVTGAPVSLAPLDSPGTASLRCAGNGVTSFDFAGLSITAIRLA
jgi:hypothetical protein